MPASYTVATTAFAIGVREKWIDNLLSHEELPGVIAGGQGVQRIISERGVVAIELVRALSEELGMTIAAASAIVRETLRDGVGLDTGFRTRSGIVLHLPVAERAAALRDQMRDALEAVTPRKRGRPPGKKKDAGR